jgi:heme exporter protein A
MRIASKFLTMPWIKILGFERSLLKIALYEQVEYTFMTSHRLLSASNLTNVRGGRHILNNLSFDIYQGEALIVTGSNGSGKTTLLRCLSGIPDDHPAVIKRESVTQAYVGHLNALKAHLTVRQNLIRQTKATPESLAALEIAPLLDREVRTLSAGQRRQVALARLPLSNAALWIADEPTTHLDTLATTHFWETVTRHLAMGGATVIAAHTAVPLPKVRTLNLD